MNYEKLEDVALQKQGDFKAPRYINPNKVKRHKELAGLQMNEDNIYIEIEEFVVVPSLVRTSVKDTTAEDKKRWRLFNTNRGLVLAVGNKCKSDVKVGDTIYVKNFDHKKTNTYGAGNVVPNERCHIFSFISQEDVDMYNDEELFIPNTGVVHEHEIIGFIKPGK